MTIFNPNGDFTTNVNILKDALGYDASATTWKLTELTNPNGDSLLLPARPGKFVSCAFMEYLGGGGYSFVIDGERHSVLRDFFGPIWKDAGHSTVDFLREPGVKVTALIVDNGLNSSITDLWEARNELNPDSPDVHRNTISNVLTLLDQGVYRVSEPDSDSPNGWRLNDWLKKAVLLSFKLNRNELVEGGPDNTFWYDKVPIKFKGWGKSDFENAGLRAVAGSIIRRGAYLAPGVVMPGFVNIGAYVDSGVMVDTWSTVGSCAQIGKNVHLSGGVGIGGVLEPLQASPTIIEDGAFIGARSEVVEGVIVRERAVLSMGVFVGKNTPIVDRPNGNRVLRGVIPANAVVMMGVHPDNGLICPQIVKYRDGQTDAATALNDFLRG